MEAVMRSNALLKENYLQDNDQPAQEAWEVRRLRIAQVVEAACDLPGNMGTVDFEEFLSAYSETKTSDFA
jgi:hypothetical protein